MAVIRPIGHVMLVYFHHVSRVASSGENKKVREDDMKVAN